MNSFEDHPQKNNVEKNHDNDTEYAYSKIFFLCILLLFFKIRKEKNVYRQKCSKNMC